MRLFLITEVSVLDPNNRLLSFEEPGSGVHLVEAPRNRVPKVSEKLFE